MPCFFFALSSNLLSRGHCRELSGRGGGNMTQMLAINYNLYNYPNFGTSFLNIFTYYTPFSSTLSTKIAQRERIELWKGILEQIPCAQLFMRSFEQFHNKAPTVSSSSGTLYYYKIHNTISTYFQRTHL